MLCYYFFAFIIDLKAFSFYFYGFYVYINECIHVNTALKNSFKSMSCSQRIWQFPRNFQRWQAPGCILIFFQIYGFNKTGVILVGTDMADRKGLADGPTRQAGQVSKCAWFNYQYYLQPPLTELTFTIQVVCAIVRLFCMISMDSSYHHFRNIVNFSLSGEGTQWSKVVRKG
jgi:hypothetical protein